MAKLGVSFYPHGLTYRNAATFGKLAEDQGFDSVFVVEGGVNNDAMAMTQAIAMATHHITVGTGIANLYVRHPATLGAGAVAIDELSDGRFILGIGVNHPGMLGSIGITWRNPREALRETTEWLHKVFAGETPPGIHTPFRAAAHPIPIHFAGIALETAELSGEIADGLMCYLISKARYQEVVARVQRGAEKAGRPVQDIEVSVLLPTFLSEDLAAARAAARRFLRFYLSVSVYQKMLQRSGFVAEIDGVIQAVSSGHQDDVDRFITDRLMDELCLVGPRSRCHERLAELAEAGVTYPVVAPQVVQGEAAAEVRRVLELFR